MMKSAVPVVPVAMTAAAVQVATTVLQHVVPVVPWVAMPPPRMAATSLLKPQVQHPLHRNLPFSASAK